MFDACSKRSVGIMPRLASTILITLISVIVCQASNDLSNLNNSQLGYPEKIPTLKGFVARYAKQRINTFYIAQTKDDEGKEYLYAYWKEDRSILLLEHFNFLGKNTDFEWLYNKARVDLRRDVVPTKEDIHGSTFLVDRPWVNRIINACTKKGKKLVIVKHSRSTSRA
jgi:hypothetical protein